MAEELGRPLQISLLEKSIVGNIDDIEFMLDYHMLVNVVFPIHPSVQRIMCILCVGSVPDLHPVKGPCTHQILHYS